MRVPQKGCDQENAADQRSPSPGGPRRPPEGDATGYVKAPPKGHKGAEMIDLNLCWVSFPITEM